MVYDSMESRVFADKVIAGASVPRRAPKGHDQAKGQTMGTVIQFQGAAERAARAADERRDTEAKRLMAIADEIDAVIVKHLHGGDIDPSDLAGLIAHRLGTLMRHLEQKSRVWDVCEKVAK